MRIKKIIFKRFCNIFSYINFYFYYFLSKSFFIILFFAISISISYADKPRVYVMPFESSYSYSSLGNGLADILKSRLNQTNKVELVEREVLDKIKQEIDRSKDEYFDSTTIAEKGKFIGATYIIKGRIIDIGHYTKDTTIGAIPKLPQIGGIKHTKVTAYVRISVDVIHVETAKTIFSTEVEGRNQSHGATIIGGDLEKIVAGGIKIGSSEFNNSMLGKAINQAFDKLMVKLLALPIYKQEFRVIGIGNNELVINAGSENGIKLGQKCKIYSIKEIINSAGKVVWENKKFITFGKVKEVAENRALIEVESTFCKLIKEKDIVEFEFQ